MRRWTQLPSTVAPVKLQRGIGEVQVASLKSLKVAEVSVSSVSELHLPAAIEFGAAATHVLSSD
jgi:hypothetical protein